MSDIVTDLAEWIASEFFTNGDDYPPEVWQDDARRFLASSPIRRLLADERERIAKAIEAVGEFDAYLATAPMVRIRAMHAHDVRTAVSIARQEPTA